MQVKPVKKTKNFLIRQIVKAVYTPKKAGYLSNNLPSFECLPCNSKNLV